MATPIPSDSLKVFDFYVEQLETYLDGELSSDEAMAVRDRLNQEPAYAAALERLHRERRLRLDVMDTIETEHADEDAAAAERLRRSVAQMTGTAPATEPADRQVAGSVPARGGRFNRWQIGTALAACMVAAFFFGAFGGGFITGSDPAQADSNTYPLAPNSVVQTNDKGQIERLTPAVNSSDDERSEQDGE
jgi:anti-sigma factor RsiW